MSEARLNQTCVNALRNFDVYKWKIFYKNLTSNRYREKVGANFWLKDGIYFRAIWPDLNITYPSDSVDWNAENGYDASMPADVIPWRPYGAGLYYGLTLVLDVESHEYYCSSTAGIGFKVSRYENSPLLFSSLYLATENFDLTKRRFQRSHLSSRKIQTETWIWND